MVVTVSATPRVAGAGGALAAELLDVLKREIGQAREGESDQAPQEGEIDQAREGESDQAREGEIDQARET